MATGKYRTPLGLVSWDPAVGSRAAGEGLGGRAPRGPTTKQLRPGTSGDCGKGRDLGPPPLLLCS